MLSLTRLSLATLLACFITISPASAQVKLRFQYDAGDKFGMTVSQEMTSKAKLQGRDIAMTERLDAVPRCGLGYRPAEYEMFGIDRGRDVLVEGGDGLSKIELVS